MSREKGEKKEKKSAAKQKQNISMTIVTRWLDHTAIFYYGHRKNQQWSLSLAPTMGNSPPRNRK